MQDFIPKDRGRDDCKKLLAMTDLLLSHNNSIAEEILALVQFKNLI